MAQNYATALNSDAMGISLSNRMSNIKLNTNVDPAEIQALVNKYTRTQGVKAPQFKGQDAFSKNTNMQNPSNLTTYQPNAPVINNNANYQNYSYMAQAPMPSMQAPQAQYVNAVQTPQCQTANQFQQYQSNYQQQTPQYTANPAQYTTQQTAYQGQTQYPEMCQTQTPFVQYSPQANYVADNYGANAYQLPSA